MTIKKFNPETETFADMEYPKKIVRVENYDVLDLIGEGSSAKVYKCRHQTTGMVYAMKIVEKKKLRNEKKRKWMRREIAISKLLKHARVVSMHHVIETDSRFYMVNDFISGGSLQTLLEKRGKLPELEAKHYMLQLLEGLRYCHSRGVCHRDLKPENLLLEGDSIKITDFGFANYISNDEEEEKSNEFVSPSVDLHPKPRARLFSRCGTPSYVAPDVICATKTCGYDGRKTDMWSCGVILYEMLTGTRPFRDDTQDFKSLFRQIQNYQYTDAGLPRDAAALIRQLLCPASDRLTLAQIGAHPWFNGAKSPVSPRKSLSVAEAGIGNAIDATESCLDRQTSTANAYCCDNVEIRHKKLIGSSTMCSNARVAIADDVLHVAVNNRLMISPSFPLPLKRILAMKLRNRGGKILIKIELRRSQKVHLKGPKKLIFVFHGTSEEDQSAALGLYEKLFASMHFSS